MLVYHGVNPFWLTHLRILGFLLWCRVSSPLLGYWFCMLSALLMALVISAVSARAPPDWCARARHSTDAAVTIILATRFILTLLARFISHDGIGIGL